MKTAHKRFLTIWGSLFALVLLSFLLWGDRFTALYGTEQVADHFAGLGWRAGLAGAGLLVADLVLPIPAAGVVGGMGAAMGFVPALLWGWSGLSLAGLTGYGLARVFGQPMAHRLAAPEDLRRYHTWFDTWGGYAVVLSRMLPILPETISVLAGLYGMNAFRFSLAVTLGSLPPAVAYAWLGTRMVGDPALAVAGLVLLSAGAWALMVRLGKQTKQR